MDTYHSNRYIITDDVSSLKEDRFLKYMFGNQSYTLFGVCVRLYSCVVTTRAGPPFQNQCPNFIHNLAYVDAGRSGDDNLYMDGESAESAY